MTKQEALDLINDYKDALIYYERASGVYVKSALKDLDEKRDRLIGALISEERP